MPTDGNGFLAPGAGIGDEAFRRQQRRSGHNDPGSRKLPGMTPAKFIQLCIISHEDEADGTDVCAHTGRAQHVQERPGEGMGHECRPGNLLLHLCLLYPASRNRKTPATLCSAGTVFDTTHPPTVLGSKKKELQDTSTVLQREKEGTSSLDKQVAAMTTELDFSRAQLASEKVSPCLLGF
jgi:hypothetical protein